MSFIIIFIIVFWNQVAIQLQQIKNNNQNVAGNI